MRLASVLQRPRAGPVTLTSHIDLLSDRSYRGSTSYGFSFSEPAISNFPGCAYDDLMRVLDAVVQQGIAAPDRLFGSGGSARGELTTWIIRQTNRLRAATACKPVINQMSQSLATDQFLVQAVLTTPPWDQEKNLWERSPLSLIGAVSTPTLLIPGEKGIRTPLTETLQYYDALQLRSIPAALIRVPAASHEEPPRSLVTARRRNRRHARLVQPLRSRAQALNFLHASIRSRHRRLARPRRCHGPRPC